MMDNGRAIPTVKKSQVEEQMEFMEHRVAELVCVIGDLEDRLVEVLRGYEPNSKDCEKTPEYVPLACRIKSQADIVGSQTDRLRNIIDRMEL